MAKGRDLLGLALFCSRELGIKRGVPALFLRRRFSGVAWGSGGMLAASPGIGESIHTTSGPVSGRSFGEHVLGRECSACVYRRVLA